MKLLKDVTTYEPFTEPNGQNTSTTHAKSEKGWRIEDHGDRVVVRGKDGRSVWFPMSAVQQAHDLEDEPKTEAKPKTDPKVK